MNRALLLLQDFEFTESLDDSAWILLTSRTLPDETPKPSVPPLTEITDHDLAGATLDEINTFIRSNESALQGLNIATLNWVIIDQKGIETSTCLVVEQVYDPDTSSMSNKYRAARLPYAEAWGMYSNLDIANMDFEDWVDIDAGPQDDGAYLWVPFPPSNEALAQDAREAQTKREAALKTLKDLGHVD